MTDGQQIIRPHGRVIVYAADPKSCEQLASAATQQGFEVTRTADLAEMKAKVATEDFVVGIIDEPDTLEQVLDLDQAAREAEKPTQFLVLPAMGTHVQFRLTRRYSCDILDAPYTLEKLGGGLFSAAGRAQLIVENLQLKRRLVSQWNDDMVGHSQALQQLRMNLQNASEHDAPTLVAGEPGCGVDTAVRTLHRYKHGTKKPLAKLDAALVPSSQIEREICGLGPHEGEGGQIIPGESCGQTDLVATGTLFIDNVEGLSLPLQQKLARGLRAKQFVAGDGQTLLDCTCKVIFGTHANLAKLADQGDIHPELARLMAESAIIVPPLRRRREDVGLLAEHFVAIAATREGRGAKQLTIDVMRMLSEQEWPENVRELQQVVDRCCAMESSDKIEVDTLKSWLEGDHKEEVDAGLTLREMERKLIEATFNRFGGNREQTAKALQIGLRTLSGKLREYGYPPRGGPGSNKTAAAARKVA